MASVLLLASLCAAPSAAADPPPPSGPDGAAAPASAPPDPALTPAAARAAIDLDDTNNRLEAVARQMAETQARATSAQTLIDETNTKIVANQVKMASLAARVRDRALFIYRRKSGADSALLEVHDASVVNSAEVYARAGFSVDARLLDQLRGVERRLSNERAQRAQLHQDLADALARLDATRQQLQDTRAHEQALLDAWGAVPVMGDSWLSADEIAAWFKATYAVPELAPGTTIDDLARLFVIEGRTEHVRGDLAFAQSIVETAAFRVDAGNNYAGIGACDSCSGGLVFATPLDGVRAQIQLLRNYADPGSRAQLLGNPPSPGLYGTDPVRAAALYDTFPLKGRAPLWNMMGNGNWATDPNYAPKVITVFAGMVAYAAQHR